MSIVNGLVASMGLIDLENHDFMVSGTCILVVNFVEKVTQPILVVRLKREVSIVLNSVSVDINVASQLLVLVYFIVRREISCITYLSERGVLLGNHVCLTEAGGSN